MSVSLVASQLLIAAISLGFFLVYVGIRQRKRIPSLGMTHAALALSAIILLIMQIADGPADKLHNIATFFLVLALVGGAMVFMLHEKGRPPSMPVVIIHAIMGVAGLALLLFSL